MKLLGIAPGPAKVQQMAIQPRGSSCTDFNGFEIKRPTSNIFEVTLTNLEVAEDNVPCTADLPSGEVPILLGAGGTNLVVGQDYEVVVNGEKTDTSPKLSVEIRPSSDSSPSITRSRIPGLPLHRVAPGVPVG